MHPRSARFLIAAVLVLIVLARVATVVQAIRRPDSAMTTDSWGFWNSGANLLHEGVYSQQPAPPLRPDSERLPGYPTLLLASMAVFGASRWPIIVFQHVLHLSACWLLYRVTASCWNRMAGLVAGLVWALDPATFIVTSYIMTDGPFAVLLTGALMLGYLRLPLPDVWRACACGLALGMLGLVRPTGAYFVPVGVVIFVLSANPRRGRTWLAAALLVACAALVIGPWIVRNQRVTGSYHLSPKGGYLLFTVASEVLALEKGISIPEADAALREGHEDVLLPPDKITYGPENDRIFKEVAWEVITDQPALTAFVLVRDAAKTMVAPSLTSFLRFFGDPDASLGFQDGSFRFGATSLGRVAFLTFEVLWMLGLYASATAGVWALIRRRSLRLLVSLAAVVAANLLFFGIVLPQARFRLPIVPVVAILFAAWVAQLTGRRDNTKES